VPQVIVLLHPKPNLRAVAEQPAETERHLGRHSGLVAGDIVERHGADLHCQRSMTARYPEGVEGIGNYIPRMAWGSPAKPGWVLSHDGLSGIVRSQQGMHFYP
jgi:hypothetical protein